MAQVVQPDDVIVVFGDSKDAGSNGPQELSPLRVAVSAYYQNGTSPPALTGPNQVGVGKPSWMTTGFNRGSPRWINLSVAGQDTNNLVARLAEIYSWNPHWVLIEIETNDADPGHAISNATFISNINAAVAGIRANCPRLRGNGIVWVQATCFGEKWPFGANSNDLTATGLGAKDDALRQRAAALGFELVEFRTDSTASGGGAGPWLDYESTHNLPGPGSDFGFLTSDGRHDIAAGCTLASQLVLAKLQLTG